MTLVVPVAGACPLWSRRCCLPRLSGIGCLSLCLAHRCCRALPQVSHGAHGTLSLVRTALRCVGLVCSSWPQGVFGSVVYQTDFVLLGSAACRCAMSTRSSSLAWHMRTCYACKCVETILRGRSSEASATAPRFSRHTWCLQSWSKNPTGDLEHVVWMDIGRRVQFADSVLCQHRFGFVQLRGRPKFVASTNVLRLQRNACCVHPRGMVLFGGTSAVGVGPCGICV